MTRYTPRWTTMLLILASAGVASAQNNGATASDSPYVSRQEYEELRKDNQQMHAEMQEMKETMQKSKEEAAADADDAQQEMDDRLKVIQSAIDRDRSGFEHFTIVGDGNISFNSARKNDSSFGAQISPLILWQLNDRLLVESAFDINIATDPNGDGPGLPSSGTTFDLTIGNISYIVNDNLLIGGGLFVVPFGQYHNHFDPPWIDKLPDDPLAFDAIVPDSEVGLFARGAVAVSNTKVTYDVYVTNGPQLSTGSAATAGMVSYDDFTDQNNNKAVGGRIGWLPVANVEMGYSFQFAEANPTHFPTVRTLLNGVDLNVREDVPALQGAFDFKTEWVWANVQRATYDPTGALGFGPLSFSNYSDGGYVQMSYRPTYLGAPIRDFELVGRYDVLNTPLSSPGGNHEQRYTIGLDYWITPSVVLKGAYEIVRQARPPRENAFLVQLGFGL